MSANNGNRSRFHITRKRRIARRMQMRSLMKAQAEKAATTAPAEAAPGPKDGSTSDAK
jgi:hypothetical protein